MSENVVPLLLIDICEFNSVGISGVHAISFPSLSKGLRGLEIRMYRIFVVGFGGYNAGMVKKKMNSILEK